MFQADRAKLPSYAGAPNERGGYAIYKVVEGRPTRPPPDDAKVNAASARVSEQIGRELMTAYLAALKAKADVKINQANLEKK